MLDANGYLAALTNPELETMSFTYTDDGLMLAKTDARQNSSTVTYDALGLLDKDQDPAGGFLDLSRSDTANGYIVSATTAEGRTSPFLAGVGIKFEKLEKNRLKSMIEPVCPAFGHNPLPDPFPACRMEFPAVPYPSRCFCVEHAVLHHLHRHHPVFADGA